MPIPKQTAFWADSLVGSPALRFTANTSGPKAIACPTAPGSGNKGRAGLRPKGYPLPPSPATMRFA